MQRQISLRGARPIAFSMSPPAKISVIVPNYNESGTIISVLESVKSQKIHDFEIEIVVIDDGSSDDSVETLKNHANLYDILIERPVNGGKGAAVIDGLNEATGDYVLFQDADLEYDPANYDRLLEPIRRHDADIVFGSRFLAPEITRVAYFWHKVGNGVITLLFNILFNSTFTDIYSCYLLFRKRLIVVDDLKSKGWEQQAEILGSIVPQAKQIYEVPIDYHGRSYEEGKKIRAHHVVAILVMIIRKRFARR